ncbi:cobyric acid synthase CobQ, partial [Halolamina salina]
LPDALAAFDGPVVGLCGGYQLLGQRLLGADVEGTGDVEAVDGVGLLPVRTTFSPEKRVEAVERELSATEDAGHPLAGATGTVAGYEIHMGDSRLADGVDSESVKRPLGPESVAFDGVLGTYLHGLFENRTAREAFVARTFAAAGVDRPTEAADEHDPYEAAAALVADNLDLSPLELPETGGEVVQR